MVTTTKKTSLLDPFRHSTITTLSQKTKTKGRGDIIKRWNHYENMENGRRISEDEEKIASRKRRSILHRAASSIMMTSIGATTISTSASATEESFAADAAATTTTTYFQQFPTLFDPLYGSSSRKTILKSVDTNIWALEQNLSLGPLETPIRCVVIKLKDGTLWVHAPLAPTIEFFELVESLADDGKGVSHVVIPTYALEHKIFAKDALKRWNKAQLWISPNQFNFPFRNVPNEYVWGRSNVDGVLSSSDTTTEAAQPSWIDEIAYETLLAGTFQIGTTKNQRFCETTFYHKSTNTLIVTDALAKIQSKPPTLSTDDKLLLISKKSTSDPMPPKTMEALQIGWEKNALLISYFFPEHEELDPEKQGVVTWTPGWHDNFLNLSTRKLFVPPVVRTLLYAQDPTQVQDWVNRITTRFENINKIVPAHWDGPIEATKEDIKDAFIFLKDDTIDPFPEEDLKRGLKFIADIVYGRR